MSPLDWIAQGVGLVATAVALWSFQQKTQRGIVCLQLISTTLFAVHFGLLGAYTGCLLNGVAAVRAALFTRLSRWRWLESPWLVGAFTAAFAGVYLLQFTLFGTAPQTLNLLLELLPVVGMVCTTLAVRSRDAGRVRLFSLISSPLWLVYNACHLSAGGVITETLSLISILTAMWRLDRTAKEKF